MVVNAFATLSADPASEGNSHLFSGSPSGTQLLAFQIGLWMSVLAPLPFSILAFSGGNSVKGNEGGFSSRKIRLKSWLFPSISVIGASYLPPVWKPPLSHLLTWLDAITNSMGMSLSKFQEIVKDREAWHAAVLGVTQSQKWLSNWTTKKHGNHISNIHLPGLHKDEVACFKVSSFIYSFNKHLLRVLYILNPM